MASRSHSLKSTPARTKETPPVRLHAVVSKHLLYLPLLVPLASYCSSKRKPARSSLRRWLRLLRLRLRVYPHHGVGVVHVGPHAHRHRILRRLLLLLLGHHIRRRLPHELISQIIQRSGEEEARVLAWLGHRHGRDVGLARESQFHHRLVGVREWIIRGKHQRVELVHRVVEREVPTEGMLLVRMSVRALARARGVGRGP